MLQYIFATGDKDFLKDDAGDRRWLPCVAAISNPVIRSLIASAPDLTIEVMSPVFTKYHLGDGRALHQFTSGEPDVDPHDHPFAFRSDVIMGGYTEEVFLTDGHTWSSRHVRRQPGDVFDVEATHIHRIVDLPQGECWTLVTAGPIVRDTRFWRFNGTVESRLWNGEWK